MAAVARVWLIGAHVLCGVVNVACYKAIFAVHQLVASLRFVFGISALQA